MTNRWRWTIFVLVVLAQLAVPAYMIGVREWVRKTGVALKFRTAPVDPVDPFRGRYIALNFADNGFFLPQPDSGEARWSYGQRVFLSFFVDTAGYAQIEALHPTPPTDTKTYLQVIVSQQYLQNDTLFYRFEFPFDRYYLDEFDAIATDLAYREANQREDQTAYAWVHVRSGQGVIEEVWVEDVPLRDWLLEQP